MKIVHPTRGSKVIPITGGYRTWRRPKHNGIDLRAPKGTTIYAAHDGKIRRGYNSRAGNWTELDGDNVMTGYSHQSRYLVKSGQTVKAGDAIGHSGATGNAVGAHLHFYVKVAGQFVNPETWLKQKGSGTGNAYEKSDKIGRVQKGLREVFPAYRNHVSVKPGELIDVDKVHGPQTTAWIKEFQRRVGLKQSGRITKATYRKLKQYGIR